MEKIMQWHWRYCSHWKQWSRLKMGCNPILEQLSFSKKLSFFFLSPLRTKLIFFIPASDWVFVWKTLFVEGQILVLPPSSFKVCSHWTTPSRSVQHWRAAPLIFLTGTVTDRKPFRCQHNVCYSDSDGVTWCEGAKATSLPDRLIESPI